jgi:hypothetical protein
MKALTNISLAVAMSTLIIAVTGQSFADISERDVIAARQDQLQNLTIECKEVRAYDVDPGESAKQPLNYWKTRIDPKREENSTLVFRFLNGNASYDRQTAKSTLNYWISKGLPAISRQTQTISATGRIEELTTQLLPNGNEAIFGGLRQLSDFSPDDTIDIALGLRFLGGRQWLTRDDFNTMEEVPQSDSTIVVLRALDGSGHLHEMRFDKRLLYAMFYYRCTGTRRSYVEIKNSDFHRFGNVFIPFKMIRNSHVVETTGEIRHPLTFTLTATSVSLNDSNNTLDQYAIAWPAHLKLFDARTNDYIEVGATTRPFSDDDIRQQLAERGQRERMLEAIAAQRIEQALNSEPITRP